MKLSIYKINLIRVQAVKALNFPKSKKLIMHFDWFYWLVSDTLKCLFWSRKNWAITLTIIYNVCLEMGSGQLIVTLYYSLSIYHPFLHNIFEAHIVFPSYISYNQSYYLCMCLFFFSTLLYENKPILMFAKGNITFKQTM